MQTIGQAVADIYCICSGILGLISALITFAVFHKAVQGYAETKTPVLARLSLAFFFIFTGFLVDGADRLYSVLLNAPVFLTTVALSLKMVGYFFLAYSHVIKVLYGGGMISVPASIIFSVPAALRTLSFFFLLYAFAETILSFFRTKRKETAALAAGLGILALSVLLQWVLELYAAPTYQLFIASLIQTFGVSMFLISLRGGG